MKKAILGALLFGLDEGSGSDTAMPLSGAELGSAFSGRSGVARSSGRRECCVVVRADIAAYEPLRRPELVNRDATPPC